MNETRAEANRKLYSLLKQAQAAIDRSEDERDLLKATVAGLIETLEPFASYRETEGARKRARTAIERANKPRAL